MGRAEHASARCRALEGLLGASDAENGALRRELACRVAEVQAEVARSRASAEGARLALRQSEAAERALAQGVDVERVIATAGGGTLYARADSGAPLGWRMENADGSSAANVVLADVAARTEERR